MWRAFCRAVPVQILDDLVAPISNADRCASPRVRRYAAIGHHAIGVRSFTGINSTDLEHASVSIGVPAPRGARVFWPGADRAMWERISAHLGAALRLRRRVAVGGQPSVIIDARGRVAHVAPELADRAVLEALGELVAAVSRARRIRMPPEAVLGAWRALFDGRWSIVASVEHDGRRALVVRPNAPGARPSAPVVRDAELAPAAPRRLSPGEYRALVALGQGHANKLIAYELGIQRSTVSTLLARAARKLGCRSRVELARAGRALARAAAPGPEVAEPA